MVSTILEEESLYGNAYSNLNTVCQILFRVIFELSHQGKDVVNLSFLYSNMKMAGWTPYKVRMWLMILFDKNILEWVDDGNLRIRVPVETA